jgi:hypothetical protein
LLISLKDSDDISFILTHFNIDDGDKKTIWPQLDFDKWAKHPLFFVGALLPLLKLSEARVPISDSDRNNENFEKKA